VTFAKAFDNSSNQVVGFQFTRRYNIDFPLTSARHYTHRNYTMMNQDRILSQSTVEGLIAEGQAIVIFENMILRLDSWLERHPGGRLVILHMVGRNATDEMKAYV